MSLITFHSLKKMGAEVKSSRTSYRGRMNMSISQIEMGLPYQVRFGV